ncbi:uncharacterized protein [Lepeophtheirus salmonis]|uniref:uncharacterized protein isoform X1 n=1 Tax=Lepeophtheirus salmonis TaxID=72036 RepID=UPI001AE7082E|nr:uncharacterized protein LOC121123363 isoform X2 [Lepeophtheirus salmonis]
MFRRMDVDGLIKSLSQEYKRDEEELKSLSQAPYQINRLATYCKSEVSLKIDCLKEELDKYAQAFKKEIDVIDQDYQTKIKNRKIILDGNQISLGECIRILSNSPSSDDVNKVLETFQSLPCVGMRNINTSMPDLTIGQTQLFDKISNNLMAGDLLYLQCRREEAKSFMLHINEIKLLSPLILSISSKNPISSKQFNSLSVELHCTKDSIRQKIFLGPECRKRINDSSVEYVNKFEDLKEVSVFAFLNNEQITNSPFLVSGLNHSDIVESFQKEDYLDMDLLKQRNKIAMDEKEDAQYISTPTLIGSNNSLSTIISQEEDQESPIKTVQKERKKVSGDEKVDAQYVSTPTLVGSIESLSTIIPGEEDHESPIKTVQDLGLSIINESVEGNTHGDDSLVLESIKLVTPPSANKSRRFISAIIKHRESMSKQETAGSPDLDNLNDLNNNINDRSVSELNTSKNSGNIAHSSFEGLLENTGNEEDELGSKSLILDAPPVVKNHTLSKWETKDCLNTTPHLIK